MKKCPKCEELKDFELFDKQLVYCKECRRKIALEWKKKNPNKVKKSDAKYNEKRNKDKPKKICNSCGKEKILSSFSYRNKDSGLLHNKCRTCQNSYNKKHYNDNVSKYKYKALSYNKNLKIKNSKELLEYYKKHPCVDCGETNPLKLTFDHVNGEKEYNIASQMHNKNWKTILKEIKKCEVRCFNCHMERHFKEENTIMWQLLCEEHNKNDF